MNLDLRPLTVSEFLDRTFSIYRHRFLLFVGLMAPQAVLALVTSLVANWISHSFSSDPNVDPLKLIVPLMIGGAALIVLMVLHYAVYALGSGATAAAVSDLYGRLQPEIGSAYRAAWRRVGPLLWLTFQISVRLFLVLLLCLGPPFALFFAAVAAEPTGTSAAVLGAVSALLLLFSMVVAMVVVIYMILRYAVAVPAVVLEPIGARAALRRSIALMRGRMLAALLLTACTVAVSVAASVMLQTPFAIGAMAVGPETKTGFLLTMIGTVTGTIGQGLTSPLIVIGMAVLYFDARVRHEALDLQIMTDALAAPVPSPAPGLTPVAPPPL